MKRLWLLSALALCGCERDKLELHYEFMRAKQAKAEKQK